MANINGFDEKMLKYFNTLPRLVQESIMQGHSDINTYDDLVSFSEHLMKKQ